MMSDLVIEIGDYPVRLSVDHPALLERLRARYAEFITDTPSAAPFHFPIEVVSDRICGSAAVQVTRSNGCWQFERDMFHAEWFPESGCGSVRQVGDYATSIDAVLRILHTLLLAPRGGFLLHAASGVRNGKAFVFSGVSGVGKTTLSRLGAARRHVAHRRDFLYSSPGGWLPGFRHSIRRRFGAETASMFPPR